MRTYFPLLEEDTLKAGLFRRIGVAHTEFYTAEEASTTIFSNATTTYLTII